MVRRKQADKDGQGGKGAAAECNGEQGVYGQGQARHDKSTKPFVCLFTAQGRGDVPGSFM
jgi:hypothetical protein